MFSCSTKEKSVHDNAYSLSNNEYKKEYEDSSKNINPTQKGISDSNKKKISFPVQNCQAIFSHPSPSQVVKVIQRIELPRYIMNYFPSVNKIEDNFYYAEEKIDDLKVDFYIKTNLRLADSILSVSKQFKQYKKKIYTKGYGFFLNGKEVNAFNHIHAADRVVLIPETLSYVVYHNKKFLIVYLSTFYYNSSRYMRPPTYFCIFEIAHKQVKSMKLFNHVRTLSEEYLLNMANY